MSTQHYDGIVIGSGQGANPLCAALAKAGWKMALVEREHVGGTCVNEGCTPTKTMVASARVAYLVRRAADYGVNVEAPSIDMAVVRQRKRDIVDQFRSGGESWMTSTPGLELVRGQGRFTGRHSVAVDLAGDEGLRELSADHIFINTGCRPQAPKLAGLDSVSWLDSTSIMELDEVPSHLLVIGGGYIGLEFGQMFRRFGAQVTIIQRGQRLLSREDPDVADAVAGILREDGVEVMLDTEPIAVRQRNAGVELTVRGSGTEQTLTGSRLLVAAGRRPNTDDLALERAGVETDERGYIQVNERLETNVGGVYALGDVKGGPAFTHISYDDYRVLRRNLVDGEQASTAGRLVPYTVFIDPQLGRVGLTETEAREAGLPVKVARMPMSRVARALETAETRGFMKAIVETPTERILGCAILGIEGGEIMALFQTAMMGNLPYTALRDGIWAHPTLAESVNNLFASLE